MTQDSAKIEAPNRAGDDPDRRDPAEADRLRDEALRRALSMPPRPQKDMKLGKSKARKRLQGKPIEARD